MQAVGRDPGAAPRSNSDESRIWVTIMTPWRVGGVFRIDLRSRNDGETEVKIRGFGFVRRDIKRIVAELRADPSAA